MRAPRVWLTGGRGMLGTALLRELEARGIEALATGREVDVAEPAALAAFAAQARPTHLVNCAAMTAVDACEGAPAAAHRANAEGPRCLAELAARHGWPLVHVSTDYVFAGTARAPYREEAPRAPRTVYGESKRLGEDHIWATLSGRVATFVVRTAWLFGHGGHHFVRTMQRLMRSREQVQVVADQVGSPTYCLDVARAITELLGVARERPAPSGTYHVANAGQTSWHGLAVATLAGDRALGGQYSCQVVEPVTSAAFVRPAPRPAYSVLSTDKLHAWLGRPMRPWSAALSAYLAAEAAHRRHDPCDGSSPGEQAL